MSHILAEQRNLLGDGLISVRSPESPKGRPPRKMATSLTIQIKSQDEAKISASLQLPTIHHREMLCRVMNGCEWPVSSSSQPR